MGLNTGFGRDLALAVLGERAGGYFPGACSREGRPRHPPNHRPCGAGGAAPPVPMKRRLHDWSISRTSQSVRQRQLRLKRPPPPRWHPYLLLVRLPPGAPAPAHPQARAQPPRQQPPHREADTSSASPATASAASGRTAAGGRGRGGNPSADGVDATRPSRHPAADADLRLTAGHTHTASATTATATAV